VEDLSTSKKFLETKNKRGYVNSSQDTINWVGYRFKTDALQLHPLKGARIYFGKKRILGKLRIYNEGGKLSFINVVDIEEYVKGVLPKEMPFYWPLEALKAQAVVARTYVLYKMKENKDKTYDVRDPTLSQVYGGKSSQRFKTDLAVWMTKKKVLNFKGELFPAYYHSCCGGQTESGDYFDSKVGCLRSIKCP